MKNLSWIALIMAALCVGILTAGCGVGEPNDITDVCSCGSCSHPTVPAQGKRSPTSARVNRTVANRARVRIRALRSRY